MSVNLALYEVDWQLPDYEEPQVAPSGSGLRARHPRRDRKPPLPDHIWSTARLVGVLVGADAVAIVGCRAGGLEIESAQPLAAALPAGTVVAVHPCLGGRRTGAISSLLSGPRRWCRCVPPRGFAYAALVASPSLARSGRMLLVANRRRRLTQQDLRVASEYLAQEQEVGPSTPGLSKPGVSKPGLSKPGVSKPGLSNLGPSEVVDLRSP